MKENNIQKNEAKKEEVQTIDTWKMKAIDALTHGCTINCDGPDGTRAS